MLKYIFLTLTLSLQAEPLKLAAVSYNIRYDARGDTGARDWDQRKDKLTGYLHNCRASVIGLQEVLHSQLDDVRKALPGHRHIGAGRLDGKTRGEHCPLFYDARVWRPDPAEQGTFWLSDTPDAAASTSWGYGIPRICTWARLVHAKTGRAIYVYNTHWDHRSQHSREESAKLILRKIRTRTHAADPFILMGDLNADTGNKAVRTLLASGILTDPGKRQFLTFNQWKAPLVPGKRIDHIFVSKHWNNASAVVEANGKATAASDHHSVVLEARL